jgi:type II secretory ATPase GspE/PulE/Tfp pilus assembly ATPase PilB-like protein
VSAHCRACLCRGCRILKLDESGYAAEDLEAIRRAIHAPDGLVLLVGPAGSGRRTTLHSMLEDLEPSRRRVILIETIAAPAVAQFAIQAAQAGYLVMSAIGLARACSAVAELGRLQVTAAQVIDGLSLVIAQRLIARLCPDCSVPDERELVRRALTGALNTWLSGHAVRARRAAPGGCPQCAHTGYHGRILAYELLEIDARARGLIASGVDPVELEHALLAGGTSIWDRGLKRVADGITSFDALLAAVRRPR